MTDRDRMLEPFAVLIGNLECRGDPSAARSDRARRCHVERSDGGRVLIQRSRDDPELLPDAICVIYASAADEVVVLEYFRLRGV